MQLPSKQYQDAYVSLRGLIERSAAHGTRRLPAGTLLVGHIPDVAPLAYLHHLYPPLEVSDINTLELRIGRTFPISLAEFYLLHNGIYLFQEIAVHGLRTSYRRSDLVEMMEQPFDIVAGNLQESLADDLIVIGSIGGYDRMRVCTRRDGSICFWEIGRKEIGPPLYPDIFMFLTTEAEKIAKKFGTNGYRIDGTGRWAKEMREQDIAKSRIKGAVGKLLGKFTT